MRIPYKNHFNKIGGSQMKNLNSEHDNQEVNTRDEIMELLKSFMYFNSGIRHFLKRFEQDPQGIKIINNKRIEWVKELDQYISKLIDYIPYILFEQDDSDLSNFFDYVLNAARFMLNFYSQPIIKKYYK